jgi:hypothetical protein
MFEIDDQETDPMAGIVCAIMSEKALAQDWLRPEEDEAWAYLQTYGQHQADERGKQLSPTSPSDPGKV